ncbi:MAG TPA: ECF-type sigma factor [Terracidiphilus sp.]|jgi:RNA polymerase sigma factor (TIGR02999 family)
MKTVTDERFFSEPRAPGVVPVAGQQASQAERQVFDQVFSLAYEDLRRMARSVRRTDPQASVSPTTLVNEAWLKLSGSPVLAATTPLHFRRIAAGAMRQVLVDAARRRHAQRRGGEASRVTFDEAAVAGIQSAQATDRDVLALDVALEVLAKLAPRQAALVEARFFGGLNTEELAQLLGTSEATVLRDWRAARAKLAVEIKRTLGMQAMMA